MSPRDPEAEERLQLLSTQLHDSLQIEDTSETHWLSHLVPQQNESWLQISVTQASQPFLSLPPVAHSECVQVLPPPPPPPPPVPQFWPQIDWTSPTQTESHELEQQNESWLQICWAHGSHEAVSASPVEQIGWS